MATLLKADGSQLTITERLTLATMQKLVGGYIEMVRLGGNEYLVVNEEGLLDGLPLNVVATALYQGIPRRHDGVIVGDAIHCAVTNIGLETETFS